MSLPIKLTLGDVTIKRTVDPATFTWDEFRTWAAGRFPTASRVPNLKLTYEDEDGDQLCILTGEDLREAMASMSRAGRALRITLCPDGSDFQAPTPTTTSTPPVARSLSSSAVDVDLERLAQEVDLEEEEAAAAAAAGVTDVPPSPARQQPQQPLPQARAAPVPPPPGPGHRPPPPPVDELLHTVLDGLRRNSNVHRTINRTRDHVLPLVGMFTPPAFATGVVGIVGNAFDTAQRVVGGDPNHDYGAPPPQPATTPATAYPTAYATATPVTGSSNGTTTSSSTTSAAPPCDVKGGQSGNVMGGAREADVATGAPHRHHHHDHRHRHGRGLRHHHHHGPRGFHPVDPTPPAAQQQQEGGQAVEVGAAEAEGQKIHWNICCDKCHTQHIAGIRYKDSVRRDYDLCESCEATDQSPFPFLKIRDPEKAPQSIVTVLPAEHDIDYSNDENRIHVGVTCDGCGASPIIGDRYRCTRRANFDLCSECEEKDTTGYPTLKIRLPSQAPAHMQVTGPTGKTCRWMGRGANRQAWRDHRDRVRERERTRQQQEQSSEGGGLAQQTEVPMARIVSSVPAQQQQQTEAEVVGVPVPLTPEQSEEMLDMALKLSLQDSNTASTSNVVEATAEESGKAEAEEGEEDLTKSAVSSASLSEAVGLSAQQAARRRLYNVRFVCDLTFPDGTAVQPRVELHKSWVLLNAGTEALPDDTRLVFAYGDRMEGPEDGVHVGAVQPGQEFTVTVPFVAPAETRQYQSVWRLESRSAAVEGEEAMVIGTRIWLDIVVEDVDLAMSSEGWTFVSDHDGAAVAASSHSSASSGHVEDEEEVVDERGLQQAAGEEEAEQQQQQLGVDVDLALEEETAAVPAPTPEEAMLTGGSAPTTPAPQQQQEVAAERDYARWTEQLQQLADIGFSDFDRCVDVLEQHYGQGGMQAVVDTLLAH